MKLFDPGEKLQQDDFQELLRRLLPGLPTSVLSLLENIHELRLYQPGETLMEEGLGATGIIALRSGVASATLGSNSSTSIRFREILAPAILGLSETMLGETSRTTIRCEHPIEAAFIPASSFFAVMRGVPLASVEFSKLISDELSATYSKLASMRTPLCGSRDGVTSP